MKFVITLLLAVLVAYISWPYYHVYKLDAALGSENPDQLAPLVDMKLVRDHLQSRLEYGIDKLSGGQQPDDSLLGTLQSKVKEWTGEIVDQSISLEQLRDILRDAAREHSDKSPPYLIAAIDFAFFESLDSFVIRLGDIDRDPDYIRMKMEAGRRVVTDVVF